MGETARILEAIAQIWPRGSDLFGADWPGIRTQLLEKFGKIATQEESEESALDAMLALLEGHPEAYADVVESLSPATIQEKGSLKPLPGRQGHVPTASDFICPEGDYEWVQRIVGQRVPFCPAHHLPLIEKPSDAEGR